MSEQSGHPEEVPFIEGNTDSIWAIGSLKEVFSPVAGTDIFVSLVGCDTTANGYSVLVTLEVLCERDAQQLEAIISETGETELSRLAQLLHDEIIAQIIPHFSGASEEEIEMLLPFSGFLTRNGPRQHSIATRRKERLYV